MNANSVPSFHDMQLDFNLLWLLQSMFALPVLQTISCPVSHDFQQRHIAYSFAKALYGNKSITQLELVEKIQHSLQELHDTARSFPTPLVLDFSRPLQWATRTGASLYLMLFQVSPRKRFMLLSLAYLGRQSFFAHDRSCCKEHDR